MGIGRTEEFRSEAVRIALTSGLSHKQVAADLGNWPVYIRQVITAHKHTELLSGPHNDKDKNWLAFARRTGHCVRSGTF